MDFYKVIGDEKKLLTNLFMCNKIITHEKIIYQMWKGEQKIMGNIEVIMPVIAAIGIVIIVIVVLIIRSMERREQIKSVDVAKFNTFVEEIKRENAEIRKDLQTVKEKVESIDGMMKDI